MPEFYQKINDIEYIITALSGSCRVQSQSDTNFGGRPL